MSLEERALEILREEDEATDSDVSDDEMDVDDSEEIVVDSDVDEDDVCMKEPEDPPIPLRDEVDDDKEEEEDDDGDDIEDLYTMNLKIRYSEPLKGIPYTRKHDDVLSIDVTSNIYYER